MTFIAQAGTILTYMLIALLTVDLAYGAYKYPRWRMAYRSLSLPLFLLNIPVLGAVAVAAVMLLRVSPGVMGFSWLNLFGQRGANINTAAADIKYFGVAFVLLLMVSLPRLAESEENLFRQGTTSWADGIKRSLLFGLVHCLVGVPLGVGLALSIAGLFFTALYFRGGTKLSTQAHFQYNLIVCVILLFSAVRLSFLA